MQLTSPQPELLLRLLLTHLARQHRNSYTLEARGILPVMLSHILRLKCLFPLASSKIGVLWELGAYLWVHWRCCWCWKSHLSGAFLAKDARNARQLFIDERSGILGVTRLQTVPASDFSSIFQLASCKIFRFYIYTWKTALTGKKGSFCASAEVMVLMWAFSGWDLGFTGKVR